MEKFGTLDSSEKTIAILGDRWWPQTAKQKGDKISKQFICNIWKKRNGRPNVGGVSIRSGNGAPSRKGCVVNGQMTKASKKWIRPFYVRTPMVEVLSTHCSHPLLYNLLYWCTHCCTDAHNAGWWVGGLVAGWASDRVGYKWVLVGLVCLGWYTGPAG